jgi:glycosyltransferase involved in cell wall biosynthesis
MIKLIPNLNFKYERLYGKISGYTTTYNAADYPFVECIKSMLGFSAEVVIVDGCSTDGTWEKLEQLASEDERIKVYQNEFNWNEPGVDGLQKAFARCLCENEFLWQMDSDEIVHEDDYEKIKLITKRFPNNIDILHLPVIELWAPHGEVTGRRHAWKWRLSRNKPEITHGINEQARLIHPETGIVYAKEGMSDGCEYIDVMTNKMLPHGGFYNDQIEMARIHMPERYAEGINEIFNHLPSVHHYSWFNLPRKIRQLKKNGVWDRMWSLLYQKESMERFPGVETEEQVQELAKHLYEQGGEDGDKIKYKFKLSRSQPAVMKEWIEKNT